MKHFVPCLGASRRKKAFSLVEVVLALSVTAFCILTIIGLFPVGLSTASESRRETRAAYLAEQLIGDLRSASFTNAAILYRASDGTLKPLPSFSLTQPTTNFLTCDEEDNVLAAATSAQYTTTGVTDAGANYLVQVTVAPTTVANLSTVSVEVSSPAQAPLTSRSRYGFQTMIGNRQ